MTNCATGQKRLTKKKKEKAPASHFSKFLPAHIWHIYKATQANTQPKLCKRAKSSTPQEFQYLPVF